MKSIRYRLLLVLIILMSSGWTVMAVTGYLAAKHEVEELFDAQMAQSARVLMALLNEELDEELLHGEQAHAIHLDYEQRGHLYESRIAFRASDRNGQVLLQTDNFPPVTTTDIHPGFIDVTENGDTWRYFILTNARHGAVLEMTQHYHPREELVSEITRQFLMPFLLMLPIMTLLIWAGIGRGLRPLRRTTREIAHRTPANLKPINTSDSPREIQPLIDSLNQLFERLAYAMDCERRFTMDAAHELRTPLAAVKTQAQVALRSSDDDERQLAIQQVVAGVDRSTHLVRQLLILARVDPDASIQEYEKLDLNDLLGESIRELTGLAEDRNVSIQTSTSEPGALILGQRELLGVLIRNLLDNAIRYSPQGGEVDCSISVSEHHATITIRDRGPGVSESGMQRMFDRFYRGLGTGQTGSGLGLSIVKRIAILHNADIATRSRTSTDPGLTVSLSFPLAPMLRGSSQ